MKYVLLHEMVCYSNIQLASKTCCHVAIVCFVKTYCKMLDINIGLSQKMIGCFRACKYLGKLRPDLQIHWPFTVCAGMLVFQSYVQFGGFKANKVTQKVDMIHCSCYGISYICAAQLTFTNAPSVKGFAGQADSLGLQSNPVTPEVHFKSIVFFF